MPRTSTTPISRTIRDAAHALTGAAHDYEPLYRLIGDARVVLLGEASHGTREFYRERARITRQLIEQHGFTLVAAEADWPDAYRINRWVRGGGGTDRDTILPRQFDAVIHFDETAAVEPLDLTAGWEEGEPPETYPSGL